MYEYITDNVWDYKNFTEAMNYIFILVAERRVNVEAML